MDERQFATRRRAFVIGTVFTLLLGVLLWRLVELQFLQFDSFRSQADRNSIRRIARDPMRGLIYDRDRTLIVDNSPSYTLTVTPFEFRRGSLPLLARLFGVDTAVVLARIAQAGRTSFDPVKIMRDMTFTQIAQLEEFRSALPGVNYTVESRRVYTGGPHLSHLLGYTKEISPALLKSLGEYYGPGDIVGHSGIEAYYEPQLRGSKGWGYHTVNALGRVMDSFDHGQNDVPAEEGADLVLSLDLGLQQHAESILRGRRGAIVALDPTNGEVLAFVSSPDYDLADFSGRISPEVWNRLRTDENFPLYNRCSMAAYPPGSTFKMMLAAAALEEGIITPGTTINCPGSYTLAGRQFGCHGAHGNITVATAIEHSCNVFFYKLIFKLGFENWSRYGAMFHFGRPTGMDIANENPGVLPSEAYYNRRYGTRWNIGYLVSLGIGQGEVNTTPLQMAAYVATLANGGTYYRPHAVREILDRDGRVLQKIAPQGERLPIRPEMLRVVQQGMYRVVNGSGTGYAARLGGIRVAGKTGTAQNPPHKDHAWFVGYAPYENPRIAVAVIIENGGYGGAAAAPVAASVIRRYIEGPPKAADPSAPPRDVEPLPAVPLENVAD